jgi:hypothetical protein
MSVSVRKLSPNIEKVKALFAKSFPEAYEAITTNAHGKTVGLAMYEAFKKGYLSASTSVDNSPSKGEKA